LLRSNRNQLSAQSQMARRLAACGCNGFMFSILDSRPVPLALVVSIILLNGDFAVARLQSIHRRQWSLDPHVLMDDPTSSLLSANATELKSVGQSQMWLTVTRGMSSLWGAGNELNKSSKPAAAKPAAAKPAASTPADPKAAADVQAREKAAVKWVQDLIKTHHALLNKKPPESAICPTSGDYKDFGCALQHSVSGMDFCTCEHPRLQSCYQPQFQQAALDDAAMKAYLAGHCAPARWFYHLAFGIFGFLFGCCCCCGGGKKTETQTTRHGRVRHRH